ncbi:MAG: YDG domain-containing protein [Clostridiales bacterium]|nr:YDG domain-containing protein [Clostridiales bacterium]
MLNTKSKKRIVQVIIACLCLCLTAGTGAYVLNNFITEASATTYDREVKSVSDWTSALSGVSSGDTVNITLTGSFTPTAKLTEIPSGVTVNLNMAGYSIYWDVLGSDASFIASSYSDTSYTNGTYYGLITNNGTLNITGTGTIRIKQIAYNSKTYENYTTLVQRCAAVVNTGTLTLGSGVILESYMSACFTNDTRKYCYIYNFGVYNDGGTVNTSGTINVGSMHTSYKGGNPSWRYVFCYGIYGGTVNVTGGTVNVQAKAGGHERAGINRATTSHACAYAIGIYSNSAIIKGSNTSISAYSATWEGIDSNATLDTQIEYAAGVMYSGTNYPVIGADVDIKGTFCHIPSGGGAMVIPGTSSDSAAELTDVGTNEFGIGYTFKQEDGTANNTVQVGYSVVGIQGSPITSAIGQGTSALGRTNYFGDYSSQTTLSVGKTGDSAVTQWYGYSSLYYLTEQAYNEQERTTSENYLTTAPYVQPSNNNQAEKGTAAIINGAPAGTNIVASTSYTNSTPAQVGAQYVIIYRYYENSVSADNLISSSYTYDSTIQKTRARVGVASTTIANYNGIMPSFSSSTVYPLTSFGVVQNSCFYELASTTFQAITSSTYANMNLSDFTNIGTDLSSGKTLSKDQTLVVYKNYVLKDPTCIRVAATNADTTISQYTTDQSFTVEYTGSALVPGTDFNIGIIDINQTYEGGNDYSDDTVVTNVYNITGTGSGSRALSYRYSSDGGSTWNTGLPKDVGTYTIEVTVNGDTDYAASNAYNRHGTTAYITCEITKANATISGATSVTGTYGSTYAQLVPTSGYTVTGKGSDSMTGTWTYSNVTSTNYPDASTHTVTLTWTPSGTTANNYNATSIDVTLIVEKREVTVNVGACTVTYGDSTPTYVLTYDNLASCDSSKTSGWLSASTIQVEVSGKYQDYYAGLPAGTYNARINTFGGADDTNNNFTLNSSTGTLTVSKRTLVYTAAATNRDYDGTTDVDVTLTYQSGIYNSDSYPATISTTGTISSPNVGDYNVTVTADDALLGTAESNYTMSISNTPTVTISQATPTGVSCTASPTTMVYDADRTLADIALTTATSNVAGTWSWEDATIVPSCDVTTYTAVFTPTNTTNYKSITQDITLTVTKAPVTVSVNEISLTYGDSVPTLSLVYTDSNGDTIDVSNIATTGNASASTNYTRGSGVGTYTITVTSTLEAVNYSFTAVNSSITVTKKTLTITAPSASITYGDNVPTFSESDLTVEGLYSGDTLASIDGGASFTYGYTVGGDAGTYAISASGSSYSSDNYNIVYVDGTLTVNKAVLSVTPDTQTISYGAAVPASYTYTLSGFVGSDTQASVAVTGTPAYTTSYTATSYVGTYPVTVDISGLSATNYTFVAVQGSLVVEKATPNIADDDVPTAEVTVGSTYSLATFSEYVATNPNNSASVTGSWAFDDADTVAVYPTTDFFSATFTPADTYNYNTVTTNVYLTVKEKAITGSPVITGSAMVGCTLTASVATMDPSDSTYYTYQWYRDDAAINDAKSSTYTTTTTDQDKTIYVIVTADTSLGYTGTAQSQSVTIKEAMQELTDAQLDIDLPSDCTYDGEAHTATVTAANGYNSYNIGTVTVMYNGSTTAPTAAGTYVVTIDTTGGSSATDYGPVAGYEVGTFTINPAPFTVTINANDKTYDGFATATATVSISGVIDNDDDDVDLASGYTFAFADAAAGEGKTVTASGLSLTGNDAANYEIVVVEGTAAINKATLTATAVATNRAYNGSSTVEITFTNISGYAAIDSASTVSIINGIGTLSSENAGTYTVDSSTITYGLSGTSAGNYTVSVSNSPSVTITRAAATPEEVTLSIGTYDAARTLANVDVNDGVTGGYWVFDDPTAVPTVSTTQYAATYYPSGTAASNYSAVSGYVTIYVTAKEVTLTADSTSVTYGSAAPTYTLTASGFTGSDTINDMGGSYSISCTYFAGSSVGDYTIRVNCSLSDDNYTFTTQTGTLTVTPATVNVTAAAVDKTYDGTNTVTVNFTVVSGIYSGDSTSDIALSTYSTTGYAATANAGTSAVTYAAPTLTGEKSSNYVLSVTPASGALTVTINKADLDVTFPTLGTVQFGSSLGTATFTGGSGNGTFAYTDSSYVPTAKGTYYTYYVTFTPTDYVNYNTQTQIVTLEVVNCKLDYIVGLAGTVQSGETITVVFTGLPTVAYDYVQYRWFRVNDNGYTAISGATGDSYVATDDDVGYTLVVLTYFDSNAPFEYAETATTDVMGVVTGIIGSTSTTVQEVKLSFWQRLINWIYRLIAAITGLSLSI